MSSQVSFIRLPEKPCVVRYLEEFGEFLIGTYEQIVEDDIQVKLPALNDASDECKRNKWQCLNGRFGSLIITNGDYCDNQYPSFKNYLSSPCTFGGGVFDLCTRYQKDEYIIYVAHANGMLASYTYNHQEGIKLLKHHSLEGSKMLTCIDYIMCDELGLSERQDLTNEKILINPPGGAILVVGNSEGRIVILNDNGIIRKSMEVTSHQDPVWQVKFLKIRVNGGVKCFVIVATEDASWLLFEYEYTTNSLIQIYKNSNQDFSAGITSISILAIRPKQEETIEPNDNQICDEQFHLLLGSYDETIKLYSLSFREQLATCDDSERLKLQVDSMGQTSIPGGGIWRVNCFRNSNDNHSTKWDLYVAAMYAGSYLIRMSIPHQQNDIIVTDVFEQPRRLEFNAGDLKLDKDPLHYGVDLVADRSFYCITDFNNNVCYFAPNITPDK